MGKAADNSVIDAAWDKVATSTRQTLCSDEPADFAGIPAVALADSTLTAGDGNGDYTIADGDTSGRKITVAQQADAEIDASGEVDHVAYDDGTTLLYVTTCTPQALTEGGTVTTPAHDFEIEDPA